jgi:cellulose biosynthesis protein BcsQ
VRTRVSKTIYNQLLMEYADKVFTTRIRINTQLKEAQMLYKTIFEHAPYSNGALDYFLFAKEIVGLDHRAESLVEAPKGEAWTT